MATVSKKKMAIKKAKRTQNRIKKREKQDSLGISRKKKKFLMTPKLYLILKIISIILPFICYFVFSLGLFTCMIISALMLIPTFLTERYHNQSYIKQNHIKIPKFDSILAIVVMLIVIAGSILSSNSKQVVPSFMKQSEFTTQIRNISTCLTGQRKMKFKIPKDFKDFDFDMDFNFGTADIPDDLPSNPPPGGFNGKQKFDFSDLPLESLFSTILSTVITVLIFMVPISSIIALIMYNKRRKKFNKYMNEVLVDEYPVLTDEDYYRIFTFDGVVIEDNTVEVNN